jgi:putative DNA primase/helicase
VTSIPFDQIQAAALAQADRLLTDWFPQGKQSGREFKVGSIRGERGESLSINLDTGLWKDFAVGQSGRDLIDLHAAISHSGDRVAAARELGKALGLIDGVNGHASRPKAAAKASGPDKWLPMIPPSHGTPRPDAMLAEFDTVHEYTDASDRVTHYVGRIEARGNRRKQFVPITYGRLGNKLGWHKQAPASPRPLYGLNRLATMPDASVILCEGEKAADAAQEQFPDRACLRGPAAPAALSMPT